MNKFNTIKIYEPFEFDRLLLYLKDAYRVLYQAYSRLIITKAKTPYSRPINKIKWELENIITRDLVLIAQAIPKNFPYEWDTESIDLAKQNKIDITIIYQLGIGFERRLGIECKLLIDKTKNDYYVRQGINRFVSGYYSAKMPLAGMIGYVAKGNIKEIIKDINKRINTQSTQQILTAEMLLRNVNHTYVSIHRRTKKLKSTRLYHIFLDFRKIIIVS